MAYGPMRLAYSASQLQTGYREPEGASQTFLRGVPLKLSSGVLVECDSNNPWSSADVVYGVSTEKGHNLTTANTPEPAYSETTPPNQPNAKIIPVGAWQRDGLCGVYRADGLNKFFISLKSGQTFSQALVVPGTYYALVKDGTTGYWYCDSTDTSGNNTVLEIIGVDSNDATIVIVQFKGTQRAFA